MSQLKPLARPPANGSRATAEPPPVDLRAQQAQCEMNYHLCMALIPGCRDGRAQWRIGLYPSDGVTVVIDTVEQAPYTTTLELTQERPQSPFLTTPRLRLRLYHDAMMAEVVGWDRHRHWRPSYHYPNAQMYHPDEKQTLNRFLGEWLSHCRRQGLASEVL